MARAHRTFPEVRSGYELNPARGYVSVIIPEAATNLVANPSVETNTTGYTAYNGATLARVSTEQRRGAWSLEVTPSALPFDGAFYTPVTLAAGTWYTFSFDILGAGGAKYRAYVANGVTPVSGLLRFRASGGWERRHVTYLETTGGARTLYVIKDDDLSVAPFYLDGLQVEAQQYPTTYLDGDQAGFVPGQQAYYWGGVAHASVSYRIAQTASGGREVRLDEMGFHLLAFVGLGMPQIDLITTPYAVLDGAFFQRARQPARSFSLIGAFNGRSLAEVQAAHGRLVSALHPNRIVPQQPLLLRWQYAEGKREIGEPLDIVCHYTGGLEGNTDNLYQERAAATFAVLGPHIRALGDRAAALALSQSFATPVGSRDNVLRVSPDGLWRDARPNFTQPVFTTSSFIVSPFGEVFHFTPDTDSIYAYDPISDTSRLITAAGGGRIRAAAVGPDGALIIGGDFTSIDTPGASVTPISAAGLAWIKTNPEGIVNHAELAGGLTLGGKEGVTSIVVDRDYVITVGGRFDDVGGVANTDYIARIPGLLGIAQSLGGATSGAGAFGVRALALGRDGRTLYIGGDFTTLAGTAAAGIAVYDGAVAELGGGVDVSVFSIAVDLRDQVWIGGDFTTAGGEAIAALAYWNGAVFQGLPGNPFSGQSADALRFAPDGRTLYLSGPGAALGLPSDIVIWNGARLLPFPIARAGSPGAPWAGAVIFFGAGQLAVTGANGATDTIYYPNRTVVDNPGAETYPVLRFFQRGAGPGHVFYIENFTTGRRIYLDNLDILQGERITLELHPGAVELASNTRGVINEYLLPGSDLDWPLAPGANTLNLLAHSDSGVLEAHILWRPWYAGVSGLET